MCASNRPVKTSTRFPMLVRNVQLIDSIKQLSLLKNSSHKFPEDRFSVYVGWTRTAMNYDNTFRRYFSGLRVVEEEKNNIVNTPPSGGRRRWTAGVQAGPGDRRARGRARESPFDRWCLRAWILYDRLRAEDVFTTRIFPATARGRRWIGFFRVLADLRLFKD